jgi:hypothetical protein
MKFLVREYDQSPPRLVEHFEGGSVRCDNKPGCGGATELHIKKEKFMNRTGGPIQQPRNRQVNLVDRPAVISIRRDRIYFNL